MYFLLVTM